MDTSVEIYEEYVIVRSCDYQYKYSKPYFSFSLSLQDYEDLYKLTQRKDLKDGENFVLQEAISEKHMILYVEGKTLKLMTSEELLPPGVFLGQNNKKFFNKL